MGVGSIPVSKVWQYLDRFNLPEWWEPILLQCDAQLVSGINKEQDVGNSSRIEKQKGTKNSAIGSAGN